MYSAILASLLAALLSATIPILLGRIVDSALARDWSRLCWLSGMGLLIILSYNVANRYFWKEQVMLAIQCSQDLIVSTSGHLLDLSMSFHNQKESGELFGKITRAGENLNFITQTLSSSAQQAVVGLFALIMVFTIHPLLTVITLATIFAHAYVTKKNADILTGPEEEICEAFEAMYALIGDFTSNIKAIKMFGMEDRAKQKYHERNEEIVGRTAELMKKWTVKQMNQRNILDMGFFCVALTAGILNGLGEITSGDVATVLAYVWIISKPLEGLASTYTMTKTGLVSIERAEQLFREEKEDDGSGDFPALEGDIVFEEVTCSYQEGHPVLEKLNLRIREGEKVALVGHSGAGKTTLFNLLCRFMETTGGKITIGGCDLKDINKKWLRQRILLIPQEASALLFCDTVYNNILFGNPAATREQVIEAAKAANAHGFITRELVDGYDTVIGEKGCSLSGGQAQRIAIARGMLAKDIKIVMLDEPTAPLDYKTESKVQEALARLTKGKTVITITHRLSSAVRQADMIVVMKEGKIVEQGTHQELLAIGGGTYRELCKIQNSEGIVIDSSFLFAGQPSNIKDNDLRCLWPVASIS